VLEIISKDIPTRIVTSIELLEDSWPKEEILQMEMVLEVFQSTEQLFQMKT
jgi:hypothetical protein